MPFGEPAWLATRYADARFVFGDRRFSRAMSVDRDYPRPNEYRLGDLGLMGMDPPEHSRLRTAISKAFSVKRVETLRPWVRQLAEQLVEKMLVQRPPVDLMEALAFPLPIAVICQLLGVPEADRAQFRVWSDAVISTGLGQSATMGEALGDLISYMSELVAERRETPQDDLISALIQASDLGQALTESEVMLLAVGLLVAGHETTVSEIGNFAYVLLDRSNEWRRLVDEPGLIPAAVEELARFVPLGTLARFPRYATEDVEVGGFLVRKGEAVLPCISAPNHDPRRFADADALCLDRTDNPHLTFGHGPHFCPGAALARLELQEVLRVLTVRAPAMRLAGEVVWKRGAQARSPLALPVEWPSDAADR
ncbi:cytochrome P450 [Amycolatopsis sp. NPDC000673]